MVVEKAIALIVLVGTNVQMRMKFPLPRPVILQHTVVPRQTDVMSLPEQDPFPLTEMLTESVNVHSA